MRHLDKYDILTDQFPLYVKIDLISDILKWFQPISFEEVCFFLVRQVKLRIQALI